MSVGDNALLLCSCLFTTGVLMGLYVTRRYLLIKPSLVFLSFFNVFVQWPCMIYIGEIRSLLDVRESGMLLMVFLFPVLSILLSLLTYHESARTVHKNLSLEFLAMPRDVLIVVAATVISAAVYFAYVPPSATGLYSILSGSDSVSSRLAREQSYKLLPTFPRYAFTIGSVVFANMVVLFTANHWWNVFTRTGWNRSARHFLAACLILLAVMVFAGASGARSMPTVPLLMTGGFFFLKDKIRISPLVIAGTLATLAVPGLIEYLRSGAESISVVANTIFERLFYIRIRSGIATVALTELHGYWGIGAIPKLALMLGVEPVDVANEVARHAYPNSPIHTGLANCSFVFSYYAYFGLAALPLCIALTLLLDAMLEITMRFIAAPFHGLAMTGVLLPLFFLTSVDYPQIIVTRGCALWLLFCIYLSRSRREAPALPRGGVSDHQPIERRRKSAWEGL